MTLLTELTDTLKKDEEKVAYESSEGRGSKEVAKLAGISHQTVVNYWKKWATLGIVEPLKVRGGLRYRRSFSLSDFGIEVPKMKVEESRGINWTWFKVQNGKLVAVFRLRTCKSANGLK